MRYKNNIKLKTRRLTTLAVKLGLLKRPSICSVCHKSGRIHAHHRDYSKVLEVDWLCSKCHCVIHDAVKTIHSLVFRPSFPIPRYLGGSGYFKARENRQGKKFLTQASNL